MGWSFRKSVRLGKGVRLNISKKGVGISAGVKGARVSVGPSGTRVSGGWGPFRHQKTLSGSGQQSNQGTSHGSPILGCGCLLVLGFFVLVCLGVFTPHHASRDDSPPVARTNRQPTKPPAVSSQSPPAPVASPVQAEAEEKTAEAKQSSVAQPEKAEEPEFDYPKHEARIWADNTGKFSAIATLVAFNGEKATLEKQDGHTVEVSVDRLSDADQVHLEKVYPIIRGKVVGITEGDVLTLTSTDNILHKIRLDGIDSPDKGQAFGARATEALRRKLYQKEVQAEITGKDRYGRELAEIYIGDRWINKELVEEGFAWHFKRYSRSIDLAEAERTARETKSGVWGTPEPVAPWDYRSTEAARRKQTAQDEPTDPIIPSPASAYGPSYSPSFSSSNRSPSYSATPSHSGSGVVHVKGYYRKDGTYVRPHTRSRPRK